MTMRGDIVFRVFGTHAGREQDVGFGAFRSEAEARALIATLQTKQMHGANWAEQYHNKGFVIGTAVVETDFEIPPLPKPRDKYAVKVNGTTDASGRTWETSAVEVVRRTDAKGGLETVGRYHRNYRMLDTFEPFRQGSRDYALIAPSYTRTAVMDLASGDVIAEEEENAPGGGFCPVGLYIPDWWDVNDGTIIPGDDRWNADHEWPCGQGGFVWGCYWGDDSSWKVQYFDLRRIREGVIVRDDRFGYVELASRGYEPAWKDLDRSMDTRSAPPPFIRVWRSGGVSRLRFDVELRFDLESGRIDDRQLRSLNGERGVEWE